MGLECNGFDRILLSLSTALERGVVELSQAAQKTQKECVLALIKVRGKAIDGLIEFGHLSWTVD